MSAWGVDLAAATVDVGVVAQDGSWLTRHAGLPNDPDEGERLVRILDVAQAFFDDLAATHPPTLVYVERPVGTIPSPILHRVSALLAVAARRAGGSPTYFEGSNVWKKALGLPGNVGKAGAIKKGVPYPPLAWAQERGFRGDHNGADALCIATHAALGLWPGLELIVQRPPRAPRQRRPRR